MKITINSSIESASKEVVDIHLEFDPMNDRDEGLASIIVTITDLVKDYQRLKDLANEQ